jgi:hypothetical protein
VLKKIFILIFILTNSLFAQKNYRVKADISIKDKLSNGKLRLTVGKVYYDKIYGKIVYQLRFPRKETLVVQDTSIFQIDENGKFLGSKGTPMLPEFTIFHMALTNRLSDYGLNDGTNFYKVSKVEKEEDAIITTWMPSDPSLNKYLGKIMMKNVKKRLEVILFYGPKGDLLSKQFFQDYTNVKGIEFPRSVTQLSYSVKDKNKENIQQTTYQNIVIDEAEQDEIYRYKIPIRKLAVQPNTKPTKSPKR